MYLNDLRTILNLFTNKSLNRGLTQQYMLDIVSDVGQLAQTVRYHLNDGDIKLDAASTAIVGKELSLLMEAILRFADSVFIQPDRIAEHVASRTVNLDVNHAVSKHVRPKIETAAGLSVESLINLYSLPLEKLGLYLTGSTVINP